MNPDHWTDAYYGPLYLDSVEDLLTPALSGLEALVIATLLRLQPGARVLDAACGHGRHLGGVAARGARAYGLDRSAAYLRRAAAEPQGTGGAGGPALVRGDVRALPFRDRSFDAAYSWYSSLFMFDDPTNAGCLAALGRAVRPGGRLLVHHGNPFRAEAEPSGSASRTLPDGTRVEEESRWDAARGVDVSRRRLVRPGGAVLAATAELRYYKPSEWRRLAVRAGLRLVEVTSTSAVATPRREPGSEAPDLIAVLETPA